MERKMQQVDDRSSSLKHRKTEREIPQLVESAMIQKQQEEQ